MLEQGGDARLQLQHLLPSSALFCGSPSCQRVTGSSVPVPTLPWALLWSSGVCVGQLSEGRACPQPQVNRRWQPWELPAGSGHPTAAPSA